jgi:hypothetical protein
MSNEVMKPTRELLASIKPIEETPDDFQTEDPETAEDIFWIDAEHLTSDEINFPDTDSLNLLYRHGKQVFDRKKRPVYCGRPLKRYQNSERWFEEVGISFRRVLEKGRQEVVEVIGVPNHSEVSEALVRRIRFIMESHGYEITQKMLSEHIENMADRNRVRVGGV